MKWYHPLNNSLARARTHACILLASFFEHTRIRASFENHTFHLLKGKLLRKNTEAKIHGSWRKEKKPQSSNNEQMKVEQIRSRRLINISSRLLWWVWHNMQTKKIFIYYGDQKPIEWHEMHIHGFHDNLNSIEMNFIIFIECI